MPTVPRVGSSSQGSFHLFSRLASLGQGGLFVLTEAHLTPPLTQPTSRALLSSSVPPLRGIAWESALSVLTGGPPYPPQLGTPRLGLGPLKRHPATKYVCLPALWEASFCTEKKNSGPCSSLVSSQGAASRQPSKRLWPAAPWTANFTRTKEGTAPGEACSQAPPWPSPLHLTRETRGAYVVHGVLDDVLQESPTTASAHVLRNHGHQGEQREEVVEPRPPRKKLLIPKGRARM